MQQLLDDVTGEPFPQLMQEMVLRPMGMTHSTYEQPLPSNGVAEAATPYDGAGKPIPGGPHTYPEMAPAGLWTTPSDLARFAIEVQKALAGDSKILSSSMTREMLTPGMGNWGLGIEVGGSKEHPYFTHGGVDEGFVSNLIVYDRGDGAVVMTNAFPGGRVAEQIIRTVADEYEWPDFRPAQRTLAKIDPAVFDGYVGAYQLAPDFLLAVRRDGNRFLTQATGQGPLEIFPESDHEFFAKDIDIQITFVTDRQGRATELILHQDGDHRAPRVEGAAAALAPREHKEVKIDPRIFDRYLGSYQLGPNFILAVTRQEDRFFAQATGQGPLEIFPESDREFFAKDVDIQITFVIDSQGRTTELILHQNGDRHAPRIQQTR